MKNFIAIVLTVSSLSALGHERMDFDWERIPGVDGIVIDRLNSCMKSTVRKYCDTDLFANIS
jgi:hypothetical protein